MAIAATTVGLSPASATLVPAEPIAEGRNITVFHNVDFVAAFGWPEGEDITVEVIRNGVVIGSATGPSVDGVEGLALEVNHGPEGAPAPGDCWDGFTPDVRPGDKISVRHGTDVSSVLVDDISLSEAVFTAGPGAGIVDVKGFARFHDGTPMPLNLLDSSEFRAAELDLRAVPQDVLPDPDPLVAAEGGFIMRYSPPGYGVFRNNDGADAEEIVEALLNDDGHATGFGHTEPAPEHSMLAEGYGDSPGPALGCEGSPAAVHAVTQTNPSVINAAAVTAGDDLVVSGSSFNATDVDVTIGGPGGPTDNVTPTPSGTGGQQTWTANFPMGDIDDLADGDLVISMVSNTAGGPVTGVSKTIKKDTVAPAAPTANPLPNPAPAPHYIGTQNVTLTAEAGATIQYGQGALPTGAAPTTAYSGPVAIANEGGVRLRAIATDAAGNSSPEFTGEYHITQPTVADAPPTAGATASDRSIDVSWTAPVFTGHVPLTGYRIQLSSPGGNQNVDVMNPAATSHTVNGLTNGESYTVAVRALNSVGAGPATSTGAAVIPATVPGAPSIGTATRGTSFADVHWGAPDNNGGRAIEAYKVTVYRNGVIERTLSADDALRDLRVGGLQTGASYRFRVSAVNAMGESLMSPFSNQVSPQTRPSAPRSVRAPVNQRGGPVTGTVRWAAPASNGGAAINGYQVRAHKVRSNGSLAPGRVVAQRPASARAATVRLTRGVYRFSVRASNAVGFGPWSALSNQRQAR